MLSDRQGTASPRARATRQLRACLQLMTLGAMLACGGLPSAPLRPEPVPYADTLPVAPPAPRDHNEIVRLLRASVGGEVGRVFSTRNLLGAEHEALNITRYDDVVNSAWFEHRNGHRRMTREAVARGATTTGPDTSETLTVIAGKADGISPGFTVRDSRGQIFLFKFDPKGNLHLASAAGVISSRLFYAAGYNTPEDYIVIFDSTCLQLDPLAQLSTESGPREMRAEDIQAVLSLTDPLPDGRFLAIASKFLPDPPLGPFLFSGVRKDDPNDHYRHEYRRELRGLYVMSSWLNHVDMRFANTLDVYVDPPGYVKHYLIDFAATLGSGTIRPHNPREGSEYNFDFWPTMGRLFTLGFYQKGWESVAYSELHPALGWIAVEGFHPGKWRPNWPNAAFNRRTVRDGYWGAKLVDSFTDEQIAAAVAEGHLPDPAAALLTDILIRRRDKISRYWFAKVTPIEKPVAELAPGELSRSTDGGPATLRISFADRGLQANLWTAEMTRYSWRFQDPVSKTRSRGEVAAAAGQRQFLQVELAGSPDPNRVAAPEDFATLSIKAIRPGASGREAKIFLRWLGGAAGYEVVGLEH